MRWGVLSILRLMYSGQMRKDALRLKYGKWQRGVQVQQMGRRVKSGLMPARRWLSWLASS